jgi:hypothetical protein
VACPQPTHIYSAKKGHLKQNEGKEGKSFYKDIHIQMRVSAHKEALLVSGMAGARGHIRSCFARV